MENTSATPTENEVVPNPTLVAEINTVKMEVGAATSRPLGTPNNQEEDNEWVWVLLELSGHERW